MSKKIFLILVLILIRISPYLLQNDMITNRSDNLDSNVPSMVVLENCNLMYSVSNSQMVDLIGPGNQFKRNYMLSGFNVTATLFNFLPPLVAYKTNYILSILIGFFGLLFLFPLITKNIPFVYQALIAFTFTFMPWFAIYNCGYVAALPFLIFAIISIYRYENLRISYLILFLFPFFSSLFLTGFFVLFYFSFFLLFLLLKGKKEEFKRLTIGFFVLIFCSIISELSIINLMFFDKSFVSHRIFRGDGNSVINFHDKLSSFIKIIKHGRTHAFSNHDYIDYFVIVASLIIGYLFFVKKRKINFLAFIVLGFVFFNTILSEFANDIFKFPFLKGFDYSRFSILNPALFYIVFVLFIDAILLYKNIIYKLVVLLFIALNARFTIKCNQDFSLNAKSCIKRLSFKESSSKMDAIYFNSYYDEPLFSECKKNMDSIEKEPVAVVLGIYPGILNFNKISTLDHYTVNYDNKYKQKFRKIIKGEIESSEFIRGKFDFYGSRCFLFSHELQDIWHPNSGELITKDREIIHLKNLKIDTNELKAMGGNFIISTVVIDNCDKLNLKLIKAITNKNSIYNIFIYHAE